MWSLPLPSGAPRRIDNILAQDAAWSPDGRQLAFANGADLFLANANGSDPRKLTSVNGFVRGIRFSPEGKRIRFTVDNAAGSTPSLWEIRLGGKDAHPLLPGWHNPSVECCGDWTPDGRYFLFVSFAGFRWNLWALQEQGGLLHHHTPEPFQLTTGPMSFPFWTPLYKWREDFR